MSFSILNSLNTPFYKICISNAVEELNLLVTKSAYSQKTVSFLKLKGFFRCIRCLTAFILLGTELRLYLEQPETVLLLYDNWH